MVDINPYALASGSVFQGRYHVIRCLKFGGMGAVYEVVDEKTDSHRALKVMLPTTIESPDFRARFSLEAKITGGIESDHIVRVSDAGIDDESGAPFLVMDLLRGEDLGARMARVPHLTLDEVALILHQVALALDKTHAAGVIHRDLKPENLFLTTRDDGTLCVKILDFGIAKIVSKPGQTVATKPLGTPLYMSPEQVRGSGKLAPQADLYALGHIAYALLVGEPYWTPETETITAMFPLMARLLEGPEERPSERAVRRRSVPLPAAFDAWFRRATALDPAQRFGTGREQASALAAALSSAVPTLAGRISAASVPSPVSFAPTLEVATGEPSPTGHEAGSHPVSVVSASNLTSDAVTSETPQKLIARGGRSGWIGVGLAAAMAVGVVAVVAERGPAKPTATPVRVTATDSENPPSDPPRSAAPEPIVPPPASVLIVPAPPSASASASPSATAPTPPSSTRPPAHPPPGKAPPAARPVVPGAKKAPVYSQD